MIARLHRRRICPGLAVPLVLVALAAPVWAQGGKKGEGAWLGLLLAPVALVAIASLQVAALMVFPAFSRRCGTAVRRYWWQTTLVGLAGFLVVLLLCAIVGAVTKSQQLGGIPFVLACFLAMLGGVGVSLEAGRWGLKRLDAGGEAHPVVEVLAGASLVWWASVIVPVVGWVFWAGASCAALGALIAALVRGKGLDEVSRPAPRPRAAPASHVAPPVVVPPVTIAPPAPPPGPAPQPVTAPPPPQTIPWPAPPQHPPVEPKMAEPGQTPPTSGDPAF